MVLCVFHGEK